MKEITTITFQESKTLRAELSQIQRLSLEATRKGDYRQVAKLTARAGKINRLLANAPVR